MKVNLMNIKEQYINQLNWIEVKLITYSSLSKYA